MRSVIIYRFISFCIIFVVLFFSISSAAASSAVVSKVPIFGFTVLQAYGIDRYDAKVFSQILRTEINKLGVYQTLEFSEITIRLAEQNLPNSCGDPQCAIIVGQIMGADCFGFGTIGKIGKAYVISMQIVEVRTGKIIRDVSEFYKGKKKRFITKIIPHFAQQICGITPSKKRR